MKLTWVLLSFLLCGLASAAPHTATPPAQVAINLGGPAWQAPDGSLFHADQPYDPVAGYGSLGGRVCDAPLPPGLPAAPLYASGRWGEFSAVFDLTNGAYDVILFACESHWTQRFQRLFHVVINDTIVMHGLDLFARARHTPQRFTIPVLVHNNRIVVRFIPLFDAPMLNAIAVRPRYRPLPARAAPLRAPLHTAPWHWDARTNSPFAIGGTRSPGGRAGNFLFRLPFSNGIYRLRLSVPPHTQPRWVSVYIQDTPLDHAAWRFNTAETVCVVSNALLQLAWYDRLRRAPLSAISVIPYEPFSTPAMPEEPLALHTLADDAFLDEVARDAFEYFLQETDPRSGLTRDTTRADIASMAASGFALSALAYAADRGWLPRAEAADRALRTLITLSTHTNLQRNGLFVHYATLDGKPISQGETGVSTVDSALLFMGVLTAGEYFGGHLAALANSLISNANWRAVVLPQPPHFVSMLWEPLVPGQITGPGRLIDTSWNEYTDETILITLLGSAAPLPDHRLPDNAFYTWQCPRATYPGAGSFIRSAPNTFFTYAFAHLWIDFRAFGRDARGISWWDNSRIAALANRQFCIDHINEFRTFSSNHWGLSACIAGEHYLVPEPMPNAYGRSQNIDGTVAPYAAGMALMFIPEFALPALREMAAIELNGVPLYARRSHGGYGFWDSFNMNVDPPLVTRAAVGIDQGPLLMAIANYRHQFFWRLLRRNSVIQEGMSVCRFSQQP